MLNAQYFPEGLLPLVVFAVVGFGLWIGGWKRREYVPPTPDELDTWERWELEFRNGRYRHGR